MKIVLEKGIPAPEVRGVGRRPRYPFGEMKVGHSFVWRGDGEALRKAAFIYGKRNAKQFVCQKNDDGTMRCWRVA